MGLAGDSFAFDGWLQDMDASKLLIALLPVWILGALMGMLVCSTCSHMRCDVRKAKFCLSSPRSMQLPRKLWFYAAAPSQMA